MTSQRLLVSNSGGGTLSYSATSSTNSGGQWLSIPQSNGTATPSNSGFIDLSIDPSTLSPGVYSATVNVTSQNGGAPVAVPLTLAVSALPQSLLLSQAGLQFTAVATGPVPPPQSFGVLNAGQGSMGWTATPQTLSAGPNWLTVTPSAGSSIANSLTPPLVRVNVNQSGLAPGTYYGSIQIGAPGAGNSLQTVSVRFDVLPTYQSPGATLSTSGLIVSGVAGDPNPADAEGIR